MEKLIEFFKKNHQQSEYMDWDLPIQVCRSAAGYYIGQLEDGVPYSRLSQHYYKTEAEAQRHLDNQTFEPRLWC